MAVGALALALVLAGCDGDGDTDAGPSADAGPGGGDAGTDGGGSDAGAGDAGPFDVGSCSAAPASIEADCPFTACGGTLDGSWCYESLCIDRDHLFGGFGGCAASDVDWSGVSGTVTGRVVFDGTTVTRIATTQLSGTVGVPSSCVPVPGICAGTVSMALTQALMPDGSATSQEQPPVGASTQSSARRAVVGSPQVTKIRLPQTTGEEWPGPGKTDPTFETIADK